MSVQITPPERAPLHEEARWLGYNYQHLYGLVRAGDVPAENHGTEKRAKWWVRPADVQAYYATRQPTKAAS